MTANEPSLQELLGMITSRFSYKNLCNSSDEDKEIYAHLYSEFCRLNSSIGVKTIEKGRALEALVAQLLKMSGNIFNVVQNVCTTTNEIDQVIQLNQKGRSLLAAGLLPGRYECFLGECKNYNKTVSVTYVGKFFSLLKVHSIKTGIMFTYHGISGSKWSYGAGLVRKIYLQNEDECQKTAIITFSNLDFKRILDGDNFFDIIDQKLNELRFDTDIATFVSTHPAENLIARQ